jgi:lipopolysaccharide biosynthesis glycosyltransferase
MKNAIFTICAKNYVAHAKTLADSIREFHPECDFFILLSDELDGNDLDCNYKIIEAKDIGIAGFEKMAFQYDVIEFSTSIKPYFISKLFNEGYDKVLYIDPDMVVYSSLNFIFNYLDDYDAVLTPHLLKPYIKYTGATSEEELLFVGIYNLGFFAIKNSLTGNHIADWWIEKLSNQCYGDKEDALHVDQRWMDFLPSLYTDEVLILRHPGVNLAFWNFHERKLSKVNSAYFVDKDYPLVILHFSGLEAHNVEAVCKKQTKYTLSTIPEYRALFEAYVERLKNNNLDKLSQLIYKYNEFDNGNSILKYHRRLFRGLVEEGHIFKDLFSTTNENSYYQFLVRNKAMLFDKEGKFKTLKKTYGSQPPIFNKVFILLRVFKSVFGIEKYYLMMRFFSIYSRFEKQTFILKKK